MDNTWQDQKVTIRDNWIGKNMSLSALVIHMREHHGFHKSAKSYERKFREWGPEFRKNQSPRAWQETISKVEKRAQRGKASEVRLRNGNIVTESKLCKVKARYVQQSISERFFPDYQRPTEVSTVTMRPPNEMQISTPPSDLHDFSDPWRDVPYVRFGYALQDSGPSNNADRHELMTLSAKVFDSLQDVSDDLKGAVFPPAHLCAFSTDIGSRNGELDKMFMDAIYWMSNHSIHIWFHALERLDTHVCRSLLRTLGRMKTTTTRVLVERLCRYALEQRLTKYLRLLNADVVLDAWRNDTSYPVLHALQSRQKELAIRLIQAGADLFSPSGSEVVVAAIEKGYNDVVQLLFQGGLNINDKLQIPLRPVQTALEVAVAKHKLETARKLVHLGAFVPDERAAKKTLLGTALRKRQLELASFLFQNGACLTLEDKSNPTALVQAVFSRSYNLSHADEVSLMQLMIDAGIELGPICTAPRDLDHAMGINGTPLQAAARFSSIEITRSLLRCGADVNATASVPDCLTKVLIEQGKFNAAHLLIQADALINPKGGPEYKLPSTIRHYKSPLGEAVEQGHAEMVQLLLDHGANPNIVEHASHTCRQTTLYVAASNGSAFITKLLLKAGAVVDETSENLAEGRGWIEENPVHTAVYNGHVEVVRILVEAGADVNATASYSGYLGTREVTVFELAAKNPNKDIINSLLSARPTTRPTMTVEVQANLLLSAVRLDDVQMVKSLLDAGAGTNGTLLQEAISRRCVHMIEVLVNAGADINSPGTVTDGTPLQEALNSDDITLARMLIAVGANIEFPPTETDGMTALQHAVRLNSADLVQVILRAAIDVNEGFTCEPLRSAAERGYVEIVEVVLAAGAAVDPHPTKGYFTALQAATSSGHCQIVRLLLEAGAYVDAGASDERGTAVQAAARYGHIEIVQLLLENGANINLLNRKADYGTALHEAIIGDHHELALILLNHYHSDPNIPGPIQWNPEGYNVYGTTLQSAMDNGDEELVHALIKAGARADILTVQERERRTPLEAAMNLDSKWAFRLALHAGADVNLAGIYRIGEGFFQHVYCFGPALVAAVSRGDADKVHDLLQAQADISRSAEIFTLSTQTAIGHLTPLQMAVLSADEIIISILLDSGADVSMTTLVPLFDPLIGDFLNAGSTLAVAVKRKLSTALLDRLIESGAQIDVPPQGNLGRTALQEAVAHGDVVLVEKLMRLGADVNAAPSDTAGATAIQIAAIHGYAGLVKMLLDRGADPWAEEAKVEGRTALEGAAEHGRTDLVQLFLNIGSERDLPRCRYARALELALQSCETVIGDLIKTSIANAKACDCNGTCFGTFLLKKMRAEGVRILENDRDP